MRINEIWSHDDGVVGALGDGVVVVVFDAPLPLPPFVLVVVVVGSFSIRFKFLQYSFSRFFRLFIVKIKIIVFNF